MFVFIIKLKTMEREISVSGLGIPFSAKNPCSVPCEEFGYIVITPSR